MQSSSKLLRGCAFRYEGCMEFFKPGCILWPESMRTICFRWDDCVACDRSLLLAFTSCPSLCPMAPICIWDHMFHSVRCNLFNPEQMVGPTLEIRIPWPHRYLTEPAITSEGVIFRVALHDQCFKCSTQYVSNVPPTGNVTNVDPCTGPSCSKIPQAYACSTSSKTHLAHLGK